jgi:dTDP-glucose pyrophosphorylase
LRTSGLAEICLVIGDEHEILKESCRKKDLQFAIQKQRFGTSDAVFFAREFAVEDNFLVVNSDNFHPIEALKE